MAGIKKLGDKTKYGTVAAIIWSGERYYMLLKNGVASLIPANIIEAAATNRQQRKVKIVRSICRLCFHGPKQCRKYKTGCFQGK